MIDSHSRGDNTSLSLGRGSQVDDDDEARSFLCPRHRLPVRGVCLHYQCSQKLICGRCFKELPEELIKAYEDIDDFLAPNRLTIFSEDINALEKESQKNFNLLKNATNALDATFDRLIEHIEMIKTKVKEQTQKKYDRDHESLHKVTETHANYRTLMKGLYKQPNEDRLAECVDTFVDLADLLRVQMKMDRSKFNVVASETHTRCSQQVEYCKGLLDKLLHLDEFPLKGNPATTRSHSVSPFKKNASLPKINASSSLLRERIQNNTVLPFKEGEMAKKLGGRGGGTQLADLTKNFELAFETIDTKMKVIEAMTYLPHEDVIVIGGVIRGDQFHKLAFQKINPAPVVTKLLTAHSNTINSLVGSQHYLFSCAKDKMIKVWELSSYDCIMVLKHESNVTGMLYDDTSGTLYSHGNFLDIRVWDLMKKKEDAPIKVPTNQISQVCFVTSNKEEGRRWIAAGCEQTGKIFLMDPKTGNAILELEGHAPVPFVSIVHFTGPNLLVGSSTDGLVKIWDLNKVQPPLLSRIMHFNSKTSPFVITSMAAGNSDGLIFLANSTHGIMAGTATESKLQGQIRFDDDGILQHFKLLYLDEKGILLSANKFNGRLVVINVSSMRNTNSVSQHRQTANFEEELHLSHDHLHEPRSNVKSYHDFQLKENAVKSNGGLKSMLLNQSMSKNKLKSSGKEIGDVQTQTSAYSNQKPTIKYQKLKKPVENDEEIRGFVESKNLDDELSL